MTFSIVGVIGQAGHGKDTVAKIICENFGFQRLALADKLKSDLAGWFEDFEEFEISRQNARDRAPHVRRLQQIYGTEIRRAQDDKYWLKEFAFRALGMATSGVPGVVISDIRFPNEATILREVWNGRLFFVAREHLEDNVDMLHASERHVKELEQLSDYTFINDGTLEDLSNKVCHVTSNLLKIARVIEERDHSGTQNTGPEKGSSEVSNRSND